MRFFVACLLSVGWGLVGTTACGGSTASGSTGGAGGASGAAASGGASGTAGAGGASGAGGSGGSAGSTAGAGGGAGSTAGAGGSSGSSAGSGGVSAFVTGRACATTDDCGPDFMCSTEAPGGYCLPGHPGGPSSCRDPEAPCPANTGSVCSPLPYHQISGVCMLGCDSTSDCRPGYVCDYVELFPGDPGTPTSAGRVCWTACQVGMDQTCNDNPTISSLHGKCEADGTCSCNAGFSKNPDTGRCR